MSDNSNNKQVSHYEQGKSHLKDALQKSAAKYGEISQSSTPHTPISAASQVGQAALAGAKDFGNAAVHYGKGFMQGVSQQHPSPGQQLNNMKINQAIAEGSKAGTNKGIEAARQKSTEKQSAASTGKSTNQGIKDFQSKASGQTVSNSKNSLSGGQSSGSSQGQGR